MEIEEIKRRKLEELMTRQQEALEEQAKFQQQVELVENFAKRYLNKDALVRYSSLKSAFPEKAIQVAALIVQFVNNGMIKKVLTDEEFKSLLQEMENPKREFKIRRK
jgi:DNA-binding TFAR19-related protein (PDSD5 family)